MMVTRTLLSNLWASVGNVASNPVRLERALVLPAGGQVRSLNE